LKIEECDEQIVSFLNQVIQSKEFVVDDLPEKKPDKRLNKTLLRGINLNIISYQYFDGVNLLTISGVSFSTVLTFMSEIGLEGIMDVFNCKEICIVAAACAQQYDQWW